MTTESPKPITDLLRDSTRDLHDAAEHHEFQRAMFKAHISRAQYAEYLSQMLLVHKSLEGHLRRLRASVPAFGLVIHEFQYQEPYIREDLAFYGVAMDAIEPSPGTRELLADIDRAAAERPLALLGFHYVLEGSNNGSKYIAANLRKAFSLEHGVGDRYLDPYGDTQVERWQAFKRDLLASPFTDTERATLVDAARRMFTGISRISDDLLAPSGV